MNDYGDLKLIKSPKIGLLNEKSLHAELKNWIAEQDDLQEVKIDGYVVDLVRDQKMIEIQTSNFSSFKKKIKKLAEKYEIEIVYPIPKIKWIVKLSSDLTTKINRRKSPKRGDIYNLFDVLVNFPRMLNKENVKLRVLLVREEELRCYDPQKAWRKRHWVTVERKLLQVDEQYFFNKPEELYRLIPDNLPGNFTTTDLSSCLNRSMRLSQKIAYCFKKMDLIQVVGKQGNSLVYCRSQPTPGY
ncbi:MAG: hypothetical protein ACP5FK_04500 [bacterium]